ncbi:MAG: hypothetical protein HQK58_15925 [Deltaproteobacteria bacterium]|nr:hypothetical protein [Deltaproteobacteria bacterium]
MPTIRETIFEEGLQQGLQQGLEQGLQLGLQHGLRQGLQRGALRNAQEDVVEILVTRFGGLPQEIVTAATTVEDLSFLKSLFKQAALTKSLEEFLQVLMISKN